MNPVRMVVLAIAAVAAIGLAVVVRIALTGKPAAQAAVPVAVKAKPMARVLAASHELRVGERLTDADLNWKSLPVEEIQADWIREDATPAQAAPSSAPPASSSAPAASVSVSAGSTKQIDANGALVSVAGMAQSLQGGPKQPFLGAVVRLPFLAGEAITRDKIVPAGESGYLAVLLAAGKRAASIPVSVDSGAGGFVLPGDRVDVLLTRKVEVGKPNSLYESKTVLRNMKVLAVDQTTQPAKDAAAVIGATVTIEVSSDEAETLAAAKAAGTLSLTLRSYADARAGTGRNGGHPLSRIGGESIPTDKSTADDGVKVFRYGQAQDSSQ